MLKSLPVTNASELWKVGDKDRCCNWGGYTQGDDADFALFSGEAYQHFRAHTQEFAGLAALQATVIGVAPPGSGPLSYYFKPLRRWLPDQWASLHRYRTSGIRKRDPLCPSRPTRIGQERANWRKSCAFSRTISTNASGIWACCPHQTAKRACRTLN